MERVLFFVGDLADRIGSTALILVGTFSLLAVICGTIVYLIA